MAGARHRSLHIAAAAAACLLAAACTDDPGASSSSGFSPASASATQPAQTAPTGEAGADPDQRGPAAVPQNRPSIGSLRGTRTTVQPARIESRYSPSEVNSVGPAMPIEIHGAPPDGASAATIAPLVRMPSHFSVRGMELVPAGTRSARVVVEFGSNSSGQRLCRNPVGRRQAWEQPLVAAFAFCVQEQFTAGTVLRSGTIEGPTDPNFANAMSNALLVLLPRDNPSVDRGPRRRRR